MERGYIEGHTAIICPTCAAYLARTEAPIANDTHQTVECHNPKCPEMGKRKRYARPFVELSELESHG